MVLSHLEENLSLLEHLIMDDFLAKCEIIYHFLLYLLRKYIVLVRVLVRNTLLMIYIDIKSHYALPIKYQRLRLWRRIPPISTRADNFIHKN